MRKGVKRWLCLKKQIQRNMYFKADTILTIYNEYQFHIGLNITSFFKETNSKEYIFQSRQNLNKQQRVSVSCWTQQSSVKIPEKKGGNIYTTITSIANDLEDSVAF